MSDEPRFHIEIIDHGETWRARVFDHDDHGADLAYATVDAGSLERALSLAAHYVLVAA